jgi:predicted nucleotidyltransferase
VKTTKLMHLGAIQKVKQVLQSAYQERLEALWVFGSVARGKAYEGSDIDLMVILNVPSQDSYWHYYREIRGLIYPVELEEDVVFDLKVFAKDDLAGIIGRTPFMERVMAERIIESSSL